MGYSQEDERMIGEQFDKLMRSCAKICKNEYDRDTDQTGLFLGEGGSRGSAPPFRGACTSVHPLAVARIVVDEIGLGVKSVIAALLHDVVEDTDYTVEDIESRFGPQDRADGGRTDQNVGRFQNQRFGAGGKFPQNAADAFRRRPGDPDQDRRPAAQHAYAGIDASA